MTAILALETSGTLCSVALDIDGNRFEMTQHLERRHNELLLGMIAELCREQDMDIRDLDALAFGCGPGSFTGVRIAAAAVQGMALALGIPVLPIPSSLVLAQAWCSTAYNPVVSDRNLVTSIRSRSQLYYLAAFQIDHGVLRQQQVDALYQSMQPLDWVLQLPGTTLMIGEQPDWWSGKEFEADVAASAIDVATLARERWQRDGGLDAAAALPLYVSGDSPWRRIDASASES